MTADEVEARFSEDGRKVTLWHPGGKMCDLHCAVWTIDPEEAVLPEPLPFRLLTVGVSFDGLAKEWFIEHRLEDGWDEDEILLRCFLAGLHRLVCIKRRVLASPDILGRGHWWGKAAIAEVTGHMEGGPWERVLALYNERKKGTEEEDGGPSDEELRALYDDLLIWRSPWLQPLDHSAHGFDTQDRELAVGLHEWDKRVRREMGFLEREGLDEAELDALPDEATRLYLRSQAEYAARLKEYLHDVKRGRRGVPGSPERLARVLWEGRREFITRFDAAARAVQRALSNCPEFTDHETRMFALLNAKSWPGADGIARVDEIIQGFLAFGEEDGQRTVGTLLFATMAGKSWAIDPVRELWHAYLNATQIYLEMQRDRDRERKRQAAGARQAREPAALATRERVPLRPEERVTELPWDEIADLEVVQSALSLIRSEARVVVMKALLDGLTRGQAADVAGVSRATVSRAEKQMREILEHLLTQEDSGLN